MKKFTLLFCILMMTVCLFGAKTDFMVNLATAKHKAAVEGKLYMVHFTANWCTPCKWMNSHTFTDDRVAQYLTDYYVPVKINVDDFDGIVIKQKNNVQFLPTLLIFNSSGEEVGRFEEAIGPSKLMLILEENNIPVNREKFDLPEPEAAVSPEAISRPLLPSIFDGSKDEPTIINSQEGATTNETVKADRPSIVYSPPVTAPIMEEPIIAKPKKEVKIEEASSSLHDDLAAASDATDINVVPTSPVVNTSNTTMNDNSTAESLAFLTGEGIFELDVNYKHKEGYSVQIGLYARYENVLAEVNKFKQMYGKTIYVHIGKKNGVTVYRLLMGSYQDKSSADKLELELKAKGLDCFVNDLSKL